MLDLDYQIRSVKDKFKELNINDSEDFNLVRNESKWKMKLR